AAIAAMLGLGWRRALPGSVLAAGLLGGSLAFGWTALSREAARSSQNIRVGLIQPSIAQTMKWDPGEHARVLDVYEALTREAGRSHPALILWPETATTLFLRGDPALQVRLAALSGAPDTPLLIGSIDRGDRARGTPLNRGFLP